MLCVHRAHEIGESIPARRLTDLTVPRCAPHRLDRQPELFDIARAMLAQKHVEPHFEPLPQRKFAVKIPISVIREIPATQHIQPF